MLRIALCQVTSGEVPDDNLALIRKKVTEAADLGARVVVFPEAAMARFGVPIAPIAEPLDGPWASAVAAIAAEHGVLVVAGMFTPGQDGRVRNTLLVTGLGEHLGYHKIHLYDAFGFRESDTVAPGEARRTIAVDGVTVGLATCYDLRFPELFRGLADDGADVVLVPASWGAGPGKREQWEVLVRARALDTGCWVAACDQADPAVTGANVNPKAPTGIGYSLLADGWGSVHQSAGQDEQTLLADLDPAVPAKAREATGTLTNRRLP